MSPKPLISPSWDVASFMDPLNQLCVKRWFVTFLPVCSQFYWVYLSTSQHTNEKLCEVKQRLYIDSGDSVCVYTNTRCECVCVHTSMCVQTHPLYQLLHIINQGLRNSSLNAIDLGLSCNFASFLFWEFPPCVIISLKWSRWRWQNHQILCYSFQK